MTPRPRRIGRYLLFEAFARGGMATVCFGRATGAVGFSRVVAIKRMHEPMAKDPDFVSMMVDEGRLAGRVRHPGVVPVIDVVQQPGELLLVMEYVDGLSLARLWRCALDQGERIPPSVAVAIVGNVLQGLHAAHEVRNERGELCGLVHRDVSPQNVIVGRDGLGRVTDFGIALARERLQFTRTEEIKGKLEYMAREQIRRERVDRRTDVYAASLVLWELVTGTRPFAGDTDQSVMRRISTAELPRASTLAPDLPAELDALISRGLSPHASERFPTALDMAAELERAVPPASQMEVARFVERVAGDELGERARRVAEIEAWREETAPVSSEETLVGEVSDDGEGPTLVVPEPVEPAPPPPSERLAGETRTNAVKNVEDGPKRRDKLVWALPLLAFALGALLLGAVAVTRLGREAEVIASPPPSPSAPTPQSPSAPTTPSAVAPTTPSASASTPPSAVAPPPPLAEPAPGAAPEASPPPPPRAPRAPRPKPSRPACDPPYTVDAHGVRVPKRECFAK